MFVLPLERIYWKIVSLISTIHIAHYFLECIYISNCQTAQIYIEFKDVKWHFAFPFTFRANRSRLALIMAYQTRVACATSLHLGMWSHLSSGCFFLFIVSSDRRQPSWMLNLRDIVWRFLCQLSYGCLKRSNAGVLLLAGWLGNWVLRQMCNWIFKDCFFISFSFLIIF